MEQNRHCDSYISDPTAPKCLRWFLLVNRMPAIDKALTEQMVGMPKLFARYNGKKVRVVMASRFGDVGITENLNAELGYDIRVAIDELTDFSGE